MAEGANKGVLIAVVVVAVVVWILFNKAQSTVVGANNSIKQTYTTGTTINAVATSVAPALGTFLSSLAGSKSSSPTYVSSSGSSSLATTSGGAAFSDDDIDALSYATDPLQDLGF